MARNNRDRSVAAHLASKEMDQLRQASFNTITIGQTIQAATVNQVLYRLKTTTEWVGNSSTSGSCDSTGNAPKILRVAVQVTWPNMRNAEPVRTDTEIAPPVGSYDPDNGHLAVRVLDRNAGSLGDVPVRVIGTGVDQTQTTTDIAGCAFFGFLPPGTYSVTLGTPGWVDRQSAPIPTQTVGVTAANITSVAFDYDEAATIEVTLAGINGGIPASAVPITLANTGLLPAGFKTVAGAGLARSVSNLFPFSDGFSAWAGSCADADPEGLDASGNRYWPGANRDNPITVDPGGSATTTIAMPTVNLEFRRDSPGASVTVIAVHAPDNGCGSGETLTLSAFVSDGTLLVAIPYGTWSMRAAGQTPHGSWETVVLDPTDTDTADVRVRIE